MTAATFVPDPSRINDAGTLSPTSLAFVIASVATAILGTCLVLALSASHSEAVLQAQKYLLDTALENMLQGLCMFESDGRIMLFNDRYAKMAGLSPTSLKGMSLLDIFELRKASGSFTGDPEKSFQQVLSDVREGNSKTRVLEMEVGRWLRVAEQPMKGGGWVSTLEDITRWREVQEQIAYMAHHDALTGLPNRALFREQLARELARTSRNEEIAVHCIDLDIFKDINDALGPPVGDQLLKEVAGRFRAALRAIDTVARIGGDEFAIIQIGPEIRTPDASSLACRINELASEPYAIAGHQIFIGTSIGISVAPDDAADPDLLLKNAEIALHLAKEGGRGTYRFFESGMDARAQARRLLQVDMRAALLRDEFEVYYQPIYALEKGQIVCFEALLRWNHPIRGTIQGRLYSAGRGYWPDPPNWELGIAPCLQGCVSLVARCSSCGQSVAAPVQEPRPCCIRDGCFIGLRSARQSVGARDHGVRFPAEQRSDPRNPAPAARSRHTPFDGRFRDGLFLS
jgi:diguanylate cyclase (GGDEF)-like protein/PAS domain S-box-containing protein